MRQIVRALLAILALVNIPALAAEKITVAALENVVARALAKSDQDAARQIDTLTLSERLSRERFQKLDAELPGPKSRSALLVLADAAEFLDLPPSDLPAVAPPSVDEQRRIVLLAVRFAADMLHKMPDFYATRDTTQYQSVEPVRRIAFAGKPVQPSAEPTFGRAQPFKQIGSSRVTVLYRDRKEVVEDLSRKNAPPWFGVENRGEFGELLGIVISDMVRSEIRWSHWEQSGARLLAVFRFAVPKDKAHYKWTYCCTVSRDGKQQAFRDSAPYQVEIAIEPETGSVLRLAVRTEPERTPVLIASEMVEYGPLEIGGISYICPLTNVVLYVARVEGIQDSTSANEPQQSFSSGFKLGYEPPISTTINHTQFEDYHLFRADMHIVPGEPKEIAPPKPALNPDLDSHLQH